jgi:acetoin utilization deacetylase AcuC-like enzyme
VKAIYDNRQRKHFPKNFMANGTRLDNPEVPARIDTLHAGALAAGCEFSSATDFGQGPIAAIHTAEYLHFLKSIYPRWQRIPNAADEVIPNIHPDKRTASYPKSAIGQAGFHQADTACPISADTWESAYWAAQSALTGAELIVDGEATAYALCRPPGHHAFADLAGGFCFINNAAVAAEHLLRAGKRPAILDVDVHHGNGTQGIFYTRADVLTVSIHADPIRFYPFFWGHAHERGEGDGLGANLNLPLSRGTGDDDYLTTLATALERIAAFGANTLVIALGLDASENDPLKGLAITTEGFGRIGKAIGEIGLPTLLVQEGGYLSDELGANLSSFINGFDVS